MIVALETLRKEDTIKRSQAVILRPVEASCAFETGKASLHNSLQPHLF